jgi:phosphate uptake regulator
MKLMMLYKDAASIIIDKSIDKAAKVRQLDELVQDTYG